jgi:hypothetical protein
MKPTDKKEFFAMLADVHDMYNVTCSTPAAEFWFTVLKAQDLAKIRAAFEAHTRHATFGRFAPKPADVMREIESNSTPDFMIGAI